MLLVHGGSANAFFLVGLVLILVIMECCWFAANEPSQQANNRLNPCYNEMLLVHLLSLKIYSLVICLNPCYNGMLLVQKIKLNKNEKKWS